MVREERFLFCLRPISDPPDPFTRSSKFADRNLPNDLRQTIVICRAIRRTIVARIKYFTPFLWFDGQAEEAMNFYVSIFKNSKVVAVARYGDAGPKGRTLSR